MHAKGSSALQIVPVLQPRVKHLANYVRGRTWLSGPFVRERLAALGGSETVTNCKHYFRVFQRSGLTFKIDQFTEEDKKKFEDDDYYRKFRWELENEFNVRRLLLSWFVKRLKEACPRVLMQQHRGILQYRQAQG